ncbi:TPA: CDP-diacylglycerol--glycerol-3-phosphate 3-phosphatidyltransferase [Campylobacter lari]|uniref:CDP-diacylglycerol--glycerol-3-phosphate 3-phosphatidyltransferase n=1 Tax=Campylobacter lari TaxID=201 RepID=UPI0021524C3D|nr:CDP-diacylglycerol--glycerol-3-phosphate 3-phosphatidyltransferase [Campylobacter lari]MCR6558521.1 CDP-diacylglycerol--glycerol-3-phosphate 3-phosphatidyltransferase [Campylobacter lari]MCV3405302.1 CDP-diacylglycerol--glycerol-3-phosphate 3-phosphatidyltransferase [Campylobacter lari]MCV3430090.1 CDP-diacylglycerol--glycerol-3-phosphate 3-phosphatidyltransferase [Campylobacter lari]HEC1782904.1 CDP-diacylglycerol--glycerol-3-phosphate 3-phosphatidyltransferase [Campylobacter lari]
MNLPNILAFIRILLAPLLFFLLINDFKNIHPSWVNYFACVVFGIAALTDFFDGYIARTWNQTTKLGAIIDPLADKMLVLAAFLGLLLTQKADPWMIYIILVREFFITGFRVVMVSEKFDVSASFAGKIKTTFQMIAIIFLIMQWPFANTLLFIALVLTLYSAFEYILAYIKHLKKV